MAELTLDWAGALDEFYAEAEPEILADLRAEVPVKTGATRDSIVVERDGDTLVAKSKDPPTTFIIKGTRPHPIDPLHPKDALFWPGAAHPVGHVDHPGTTANPFSERALDRVKPILKAKLAAAVRAHLRAG